MNSRTVTQNGTYNHDKQTNENTKVHRHWVQEALITPMPQCGKQSNLYKLYIYFGFLTKATIIGYYNVFNG